MNVRKNLKFPIMTILLVESMVFSFARESAPKGIVHTENSFLPASTRIHFDGLKFDIKEYPATGRVFAVTPSHKNLEGGIDGVVFAVEDTVADPEDLAMPVLSREDERQMAGKETALFYDRMHDEIDVEQMSETPPDLVHASGQGFFAAVLIAFARHLPLKLGPDQIWALISYAFARHVDLNAEELRHHFVKHEGKKRLSVELSFFPGGGSPSDWEVEAFPGFSSQIREHIGEETHEAIAGSFSTTSAVEKAAHEVTLMSAMKNYFSFGLTFCGIPKITLLGTEADWVNLRARAEALGSKMTPDFRDFWLPRLLPVLDQFVEAYRGNVHHGFWQSMVKMRQNTQQGSGASGNYANGWVQILYPYLKHGNLNRKMQFWEHCYWEGPNIEELPSILSSAPVDWEIGKDAPLEIHFHAGITGFTQDKEDGALCPVSGWRITHDPEKDPKTRIRNYKKEMKELKKGLSGNKEKDKKSRERIGVLEYLIRKMENILKLDKERK